MLSPSGPRASSCFPTGPSVFAPGHPPWHRFCPPRWLGPMPHPSACLVRGSCNTKEGSLPYQKALRKALVICNASATPLLHRSFFLSSMVCLPKRRAPLPFASLKLPPSRNHFPPRLAHCCLPLTALSPVICLFALYLYLICITVAVIFISVFYLSRD